MADAKAGAGAELASMWSRAPGWVKVAAVLAAIVLLRGIFSSPDEPTRRATPARMEEPAPAVQTGPSAVEACVERGMAYFSSLGSYPKLSDGRDAIEVARERCSRDLKAF